MGPAIAIIYITLVLTLIGLFLAVMVDSFIDRSKRRVFLILILLIFTLLAQNSLEYLCYLNGQNPRATLLVSMYGYIARPTILAMCCYVVDMKRGHILVWALIGINTIVHLTALFSDICFTITDENIFHRGPLGYTCHIVSAIILFYLLWLTLNTYADVRRRDKVIPIFCVISIIGAVLFDSRPQYSDYQVSFLTVTVVVTNVFYYIWLHQQFEREHEQDLWAQQRIQIMMTQIQPHFLYNTIATFKALCRKDPEKAAEVADKFGGYLRQNMDNLDVQGLIPFEKELGHTKLYADIEMVRFENIRVEYDIKDSDYCVPPLSVQPIVENAIRHGVRIRDEGIVRVASEKKYGAHEIVVTDNGTGFDISELKKQSGRHIGIGNVKERVEKMCKGSLDIDSLKGVGTKVTIRIPDKGGWKQTNENDMRG